MKEPEIPYKSIKYIREPEYNKETLSHKVYVHEEYFDLYEEEFEDGRESDEEVMPECLEWSYNNELFSLQDLLDLSKGRDPKEVIISVHRDRQMTSIEVTVEHRWKPDLKKWHEEKEAEEKDYQERLAIYNIEKSKYDIWKAQEEISKKQKEIIKRQEEIKKLENKIKK